MNSVASRDAEKAKDAMYAKEKIFKAQRIN